MTNAEIDLGSRPSIGLKMTGERQRSSQRQVLQRLRTDQWRSLVQLNVSAGDTLLASLVRNGWMERRGEHPTIELKVTPTGLDALRAKIPR
jgi:hypothetical protein